LFRFLGFQRPAPSCVQWEVPRFLDAREAFAAELSVALVGELGPNAHRFQGLHIPHSQARDRVELRRKTFESRGRCRRG
jgi:hypothetical protein